MAAGLLFIAVVFFSARGFFLGLPGVFARLLGLICGYVVAFSYRSELAKMLATQVENGIPQLLLQVVSGTILFFGSMFLVGLVVTGVFKVLAKLIPPLRGILSKEATGSRIAGAVFNGAIGAALILAGMWIYGITLGKNQQPDALQQFANRFGDALIAATQFSLQDEPPANSPTINSASNISSDGSRQPSTGSAEIVSSDDPQKRVAIETLHQIMADPSSNDIDFDALLKNKELQTLFNDPAVKEKAMRYLQDHPQQIMEALNNPKFRALLEQTETQ